jgi:flagellar basal body-associated protein FliL
MRRRPLPPLAVLILVPSLAAAADAAPVTEPATDAVNKDAPLPPTTLDPTAAVVSEGKFIYRQRDLDALVLIAERHAKTKLTRDEIDQIRRTLLNALTAREPLAEALATLPTSVSAKARDALILDLIDYKAEPAPHRPPASAIIKPSDMPQSPDTASDAPAAGGEAAKPADDSSKQSAEGPVLVRLPPLTMVRTLEGIGKRQMQIGLALYFTDAGLAKKLEDKAPLIQDAVLSYLQKLDAAQFNEPDQVALKEGLVKAIQGRAAEFPNDGVLIPQLDVTVPEAK